MRKIPFLIFLPPFVFFALAALFFLGMNKSDNGKLESTLIGNRPPDISEIGLEGFTVLKNEMFTSGEVILVNFWASWCPPCRAEHPTLSELSERGIKLYGVNFKDRPENAVQFLEQHGNPFDAIASDKDGRAGLNWGVTGLPETFIIGDDGTILYRFAGPLVEGNYLNLFLPELDKALVN